jgi:hypothetical protein
MDAFTKYNYFVHGNIRRIFYQRISQHLHAPRYMNDCFRHASPAMLCVFFLLTVAAFASGRCVDDYQWVSRDDVPVSCLDADDHTGPSIAVVVFIEDRIDPDLMAAVKHCQRRTLDRYAWRHRVVVCIASLQVDRRDITTRPSRESVIALMLYRTNFVISLGLTALVGDNSPDPRLVISQMGNKDIMISSRPHSYNIPPAIVVRSTDWTIAVFSRKYRMIDEKDYEMHTALTECQLDVAGPCMHFNGTFASDFVGLNDAYMQLINRPECIYA